MNSIITEKRDDREGCEEPQPEQDRLVVTDHEIFLFQQVENTAAAGQVYCVIKIHIINILTRVYRDRKFVPDIKEGHKDGTGSRAN